MAVFQYDPENESDGEDGQPDGDFVTVSNNGPDGYNNYQMAIPKSVAEEVGINEGDQLIVKPLEGGFEVQIT